MTEQVTGEIVETGERDTVATSGAARFLGMVLHRFDSFANEILNMGGSRDPSAYTSVTARPKLTDAALEALYNEDPLAAFAVEAVVLETVSAGHDLVVANGNPTKAAEIRDAYKEAETKVGLVEELTAAAIWGRLFGGGVSWLGADDGSDPSTPLNERAIRTFRWVHTFDRTEAHVRRYYADPSSPKLGRPMTYLLQPRLTAGLASLGGIGMGGTATFAGGVEVHESRLLIWPGQRVTRDRWLSNAGWDDSVLERAYEALRQVAEDYSAKSMLLSRISQAVYKIEGLYSKIAGKQSEVLRTRLALLDLSRSRGRAIALDADKESLETVNQPVSGLAELADRSTIRAGAAVGAPVAIAFGANPSTGEGPKPDDEKAWARTRGRWREAVWRKRHERAARLLLAADDGPTGGRDAVVAMEYRALIPLEPKEEAELRKIAADTLAIMIEKGVVPPEAVALALYTATGTGRVLLDSAEVSAALERRRLAAGQPPKDNAELGTVGARASSAIEIVEKMGDGRISRETARSLLTELFKFDGPIADAILGPVNFVPTPPAGKTTPGPLPEPKLGGGAGAPQPPKGTPEAGGDPDDPAREKTTTGEPEGTETP